MDHTVLFPIPFVSKFKKSIVKLFSKYLHILQKKQASRSIIAQPDAREFAPF